MVSGLRVTLTKTELQALLKLARFSVDQLPAARHHYILAQRQVDIATDVIKSLELSLTSIQLKQAETKARREAPKREADPPGKGDSPCGNYAISSPPLACCSRGRSAGRFTAGRYANGRSRSRARADPTNSIPITLIPDDGTTHVRMLRPVHSHIIAD
ncbi:MAG: hypothetical protein B7Z20_00335 [Sphingobium sp. 32-64-5]|nr:MAG: hypothetical protein B7Z20_00335 [Sphingobium sp. 32-64-5]